MHRVSFKLEILLFLAILSLRPALAQLEGGIITGSVHDSTGAVVPGAAIDVQNVATGEHLSLVSNNDGNFTTPALRVGSYTVAASHPGFKSTVQSGIILEIGSRPAINLVLQVGTMNQSVQVTALAPAMNTTTATVGTVVEDRPVEELPLNGRNALALVLITPGVRSTGGANYEGFADRGTLLSSIVINNGPSALNGNLLDGANNLIDYTGEISINPAVDTIQEFNVMTGVMPAEYGFTGGGIINMATKSGSNSLHGTVYEFLRNNALDARDYFLSPTARIPELRYNQFGAAVGGPIVRNRAFFFANYEEFRYIASTVTVGTVPTLLERQGNFSQLYGTNGSLIPIYNPATTRPNPSGAGYVRSPFAGNIINTPLDPVALAIQNAIYPEPNRPPTNTLTQANNFEAVIPNHRQMRQSMGRIDYRISGHQSAFLRYAYFNHYTDQGGSIASYLTAPEVAYRYDNLVNQSAILSDTYTFSPFLINEFRLAANRTSFPFTLASYNGNWPQKLGFPSNVPSTVFPTPSGNGLPSWTGTVGFRAATNPQITDTVTVLKGAHNIRFGLDWRLNRGANSQTSYPSGLFNFTGALTGNPQSPSGTGNSYASFLLGQVSTSEVVLTEGTGDRNFSISPYVEDDWKVTPRFTLNAGLRYDYQSEPVEQKNGISNFNPYIVSPVSGLLGATQYAGVNGAPRSFTKNDYHDFGPRIGFAWDVFGDGRTSVRGGYGIYYVSLFNTLFFGSTNAFAATTTNYNPPGNNTNFATNQLSSGFPSAPIQPQGAKLGADGFLGQSASYQAPRGNTPMSQQVDFAIQREMPKGIVVEAVYLNNHGTNMVAGGYNLNQLNPQYLALGTKLQDLVPNPYAGRVPGSLGAATITRAQLLLPYPYYASITAYSPRDGVFHGDSLEINVTRHSSNGLTLLANYTISKLLDFGIATPVNFNGVTQAGVTTPQNSYNRLGEYGIDPTDVSKRASISLLYNLPFGHAQSYAANVSGLVNGLIGGWQLNAISLLQSGTPLTITGANNNTATRPNFVPGVSPKLAHGDKAEWFNTAAFVNPPLYTYGNVPRSLPSVRGPALINLDLSAFKTTQIHENLALQFRIEAFNALNHPNFGLPGMSFSPGSNGLNASGSFGTITSDLNPRALQVALKVLF